MIMGSPLMKKSYQSPEKTNHVPSGYSKSNSSRFANAPGIMRESDASKSSSVYPTPTSFKDNDSIHKDILRLGLFERSVEEPSARVPNV